MSSIAAPYGAEPVGTLSASGSFSGKMRHYKIASGYTPAIYYGDFVKLATTGVVEKDVVTDTRVTGMCGIFMGCSYTDPNTGQTTIAQKWTALTAAADAVAYVLDDPNVVFKMQADDTLAQTAIGMNVSVVQTAGSAAVGRSRNAVDASEIAATATLPIRIVEFVQGPDSAVGDAFTDVHCVFNGHFFSQTTGMA